VSVIMISEVPGADASLVDGLLAAGLTEAMASAPGFVSHLSGPTATGYCVVEVWETQEAHQAWLDEHITPSLPPGLQPAPPEYVPLLLTVPQA
jgi:hypothetical protein